LLGCLFHQNSKYDLKHSCACYTWTPSFGKKSNINYHYRLSHSRYITNWGKKNFHYKFEINFAIFWGKISPIFQYHKIEKKKKSWLWVSAWNFFWERWWDLKEPSRNIVQCEILLIQQCCETFDLCNEICVSYFRQNEMPINLVFTSWLKNGFKFNCYHFYSLNNSLWDEFIYLFIFIASSVKTFSLLQLGTMYMVMP